MDDGLLMEIVQGFKDVFADSSHLSLGQWSIHR